MGTQLQAALAGVVTREMERVAEKEGLEPEMIRQGVARGTIVIPANPFHTNLDPHGIGAGLRTKVNANLGTSGDFPHVEDELDKLRIALEAGADAVMDLSTGSAETIDRSRRAIIKNSTVMVGTVPIYQAAVEAREKWGATTRMTADGIFEVISRHAEDGVDFITVHCGVSLESVSRLRREGRVVDIVSRGGALLAGWMLHNERENPLLEEYDHLLEIARKHDVTLSLGDGLRPGCLADATDRGQLHELLLLGELVDRARAAGVQVMVEGPGHVPMNQVEANVILQKRVCHGAPFYVLGPLVTDVAPGYDHITSAIGGALAAAAGADFLCYVTATEHLGLPGPDEVHEGIITARIAGHAADLVKGIRGAWEWDLEMSKARKALDWEKQLALAIDPVKARRLRGKLNPAGKKECSMCGSYCAMELVSQVFGGERLEC